MPELPEVETVRRSLLPRLEGRSIASVEVRAPALREPLDQDALHGLAGHQVLGIRRRAKYLLIDLDTPRTLVVHLGMSGRFTLVAGDAPRAAHEHVAFHLDDGRRLRFVDPRRFGQVLVLPTDRLEDDRHFAHLGLEPLGEAFDGAALEARAAGRRGPMKAFLMDAKVVVGVGNIYVSEALWRARVHPRRSVARTASATWVRLADAVRSVLADAVAEGGTTLNDFTDGEGNAGYFQVSLRAYGREDEPCARCETPIRRIVQSNRSTFYCPRCQR
ncbi:MAG: bifunctional DNA-formamidopyrimidine glycosylase/DNA-(apurinic or apyrimidinic site) lyase [Acidobacteriota bacterium]